MTSVPYVRLRQKDLAETSAIHTWFEAPAELLSALGLALGRRLALPLAGPRGETGRVSRRQLREGLATLLALEPSHPDRTLYLEVLLLCDPRFERWLARRIQRAFSTKRHARVLREAVAAVNLAPGRAEGRFNLGLLLTAIVCGDPHGSDARRWTALARGEFARAADLAPDLFWGYYHRGVMAYEAGVPDAARADWLRFLEKLLADKPAPRTLKLPLLPLRGAEASADLPGLAYAVLLDLLGLPSPSRQAAQPTR